MSNNIFVASHDSYLSVCGFNDSGHVQTCSAFVHIMQKENLGSVLDLLATVSRLV